MREVLDELSVGVMFLSGKGEVEYANRFFIRSGLLPPDYQGKMYYEVIRSLDLIGFVRELLEGRAKTASFERSGRVYRVSSLGERSFQIEDITELVRFEKLQREFVAAVSHELSTPLTAVKGLLETALLQETPSREFLEKALRRVGDLEKLINSLRLLILLDSGQKPLKEKFSLKGLVKDVLGDLEEEISRKEIEVELVGEEVQIESDREKLYLLLKNLIENAIKYNREGGRVSVRIEGKPQETRVVVEDTGEGIPKEDMPLIFQPFFGGKNRKGMGLGLAIAKRIADFLGAEIRIRSEEGKGTTAELLLP